jgi:voltage-gated potassium channel
LRNRLLRLALMPLVLLACGALGYRLIEGSSWSWLDALYMAAITLTTVGYAETHPLSPEGRVFTIVYSVGGVFTMFYMASELIRFVVSGEIRSAMGKRRMEQKLADLRNHYIVCGYGRMGRFVCQEFEAHRLPHVVIDKDTNVGQEFPTRHGLFVYGDATSDLVLNHVGVTRAKALVTVASSDADNLYIVLSARLLSDKLFIVARAEETGAEEKLKRVGANRVISPYLIGGTRVALAVMRPTVVDVIDLATRKDSHELQIEEIKLEPGSGIAGLTLSRCGLAEMGLNVVAIKRPDGALTASPPGSAELEANSTIVVIGSRDNLDKLARMAEGTPRAGDAPR